MAARWRRIVYLAVWTALLVLVVLTFDYRAADGEAQVVLLAIIIVLAVPISVLALCVVYTVIWLFPDLPPLINALGDTPLLSNDPAWFKLQFSFWWLLALAASYWQWFRLVPRLLSILQRWINRGQGRASPQERR